MSDSKAMVNNLKASQQDLRMKDWRAAFLLPLFKYPQVLTFFKQKNVNSIKSVSRKSNKNIFFFTVRVNKTPLFSVKQDIDIFPESIAMQSFITTLICAFPFICVHQWTHVKQLLNIQYEEQVSIHYVITPLIMQLFHSFNWHYKLTDTSGTKTSVSSHALSLFLSLLVFSLLGLLFQSRVFSSTSKYLISFSSFRIQLTVNLLPAFLVTPVFPLFFEGT